MQRLEQAIVQYNQTIKTKYSNNYYSHSDQRAYIRKDISLRASMILSSLVAAPLCAYLLYVQSSLLKHLQHLFTPYGVMHNHRSTAGAYLHWPQNFMTKLKPFTQVYRPEIYNRETSLSLIMYSKKMQKIRKEDPASLAGQNVPYAWH
ncbi:UNKNOWN [Stylonychia lemnae]|uniref:Uncharacterized protein n=1 Tax=Stylonychia lemnae TaxID=5949 RepID=A0A078AEZ5_STYLE|nr:UNKNOWN [Stylonychia lemnae]|eukprot:CDW80795.1 UNKNOWN [Stylonychia lemnae]